jgi:hypothetical protein
MKRIYTILAILVIAASAVSANAVTALEADFFAAGSSAQFNTFALAAANSGLCGSNYWIETTSGPNPATLVDPRSGLILPEAGNIWIVWNAAAAAGTSGGIVCAYVSVDSVIGLRAYFASDTISLPAAAVGTTGNGSVPYISGTSTALPANIQTYVNGAKINYGATDIRPEDGKFATLRALTAYGAFITGRGFTGVGYQGSASTPWLGVPIVSSVSSAQANPVDWAFVPGDTDPVTGAAPRVYKELEVGAAPVLVVANVSNTSAGHLGDPNLNITNIPRFLLSKVLLGQVGHVRDLTSATDSYSSDAALHVWIREPTSGTYNTIDFTVPNSNEIAGDYAQATGRVTGQEAGITPTNTTCAGHQTSSGCPSGDYPSGNPLFLEYTPTIGSPNGSTRGRTIGTGEMISTVNSNADSIGYAFWGFSSFSTSKAPNLKYLTVDGADPLYSSINPNPGGSGVLPQCPATPCILPFDNIKNGGYPIWSKYRGVYDYSDPLNLATNMVALAQSASTSTYSDFVPATALYVFRSHFAQVVTTSGKGYSPNNGNITGIPETGGDMGGAVLTVQSDQDFYADSGGNQQTGLKQ